MFSDSFVFVFVIHFRFASIRHEYAIRIMIRPRSVFDRYRCNTRRWDEQGTDMNAKKIEIYGTKMRY